MKNETEINRENAMELSRLMLENPQMRVMAQIDSDGINDDYAWYAGDIGKPYITTMAYTEYVEPEHYIEKDGDDLEDCVAYYGYDAEDWDKETIKKKAAEIPWYDVIVVRVSAC